MRLWHYKLISIISTQRLLGQHRECCALRGNGWGRKHSTVDYVFKYNFWTLVNYHFKVMVELERRNIKIYPAWYYASYRGCTTQYVSFSDLPNSNIIIMDHYPEHNGAYLTECIKLLIDKNDKPYRPKEFNRLAGEVL